MATISKRTSKKGEVSYLIRVSLGYNKSGQQIVKSMTYKPESGMKPKAVEKELNRQAVLFEEQAKQDYEQQLKREAEQQEQSDNEIAYAKNHITFKELADEWLSLQEVSKELKPSSLLKMKSCKERSYNAIGNILVSKLSYRKIQAFISSLAKNGMNQKTGGGLSEKTQKHYLTFISDIMLYAKKCGYIDSNPCRDITFTKSVKKEKEVYSLDEAKALLAAIDKKAPLNYRLFFNLLAYSGMRRGEALGLEYKDINFETSVLTICRTSNYHQGYGVYTDTPKTKSSYRSLYIQHSIIITWNGKPLHPSAPYKWLKRFCEHEKLTFKALHSFRHFVASQALASGIDVKAVSNMLGHSQTSTTLNIYAHAVQQANENALNSVAKLLEIS